jgi:hypothetical protein
MRTGVNFPAHGNLSRCGRKFARAVCPDLSFTIIPEDTFLLFQSFDRIDGIKAERIVFTKIPSNSPFSLPKILPVKKKAVLLQQQ